MKERPILFSGPMVRAILDGRKTQTRRVMVPQFSNLWGFGITFNEPEHFSAHIDVKQPDGTWMWLRCPYGKPGDRLWVREKWWLINAQREFNEVCVAYDADESEFPFRPSIALDDDEFQKWADRLYRGPHKRPSIHMPRWASRITLEIANVSVERLQSISEDDAEREGIELVEHNCYKNYLSGTPQDKQPGYEYLQDPIGSFCSLWDSINAAKHPWSSNPWVWVVEFEMAKEAE